MENKEKMDNDEAIESLENEKTEQITVTKDESKKQLPLGALIGIIAGAVAVIVAVILIIVFTGGNGDEGEGCIGHVDADDDYLCDKCGEHFDDGDEVEIPAVDKINVTFTVKLDDGTPLSGVKFILTRGDKTIELISGMNGIIFAGIEEGAYHVTYDHDTLPEYCWGETYGVKIEKNTSSVDIIVVDNRPDGSAEKPYSASEEKMTIEIAPGEELYYSCHGTSLRYVTVKASDLVVTYDGTTYTAENGVITVGVSSVDVNTPIVFSIKNTSDHTVVADMEIYAPLGSSENPIELTESDAVVEVPAEKTVYYVYKADKDGILVVTTPTIGGEILITRNIVRVTDGVEEILSTITAECRDSSAGYVYVREGEEIKLGVSYVAPGNDDKVDAQDSNGGNDSSVNSVEFSVSLYAATESEPAPVTVDNLYIRLDEGASVVFSAEEGKTVTVESENAIAISYNGADVQIGEGFVISGEAEFKITNSSEQLAIFTVKLN